MTVWRSLLLVAILVLLPQISPVLFAQDMDTQDGIFRQEYEQLLAQENALLGQAEQLKDLKSRVDDLIDAARATPTANYAEEANRYERLQLLLPSAIKYSQELDQTLRKLDAIQRKKADLRARVLQRQSDVPIWWTQ